MNDKADGPDCLISPCSLKRIHEWLIYGEKNIERKALRSEEYEKELERILKWYKIEGGTVPLTTTQLDILAELCDKVEGDPFDTILFVMLLPENIWEHLEVNLEEGTFMMSKEGYEILNKDEVKPPQIKTGFPPALRVKH